MHEEYQTLDMLVPTVVGRTEAPKNPADHLEDIKALNKWLKDTFGKEIDGRAKWKITWADAEFEYRLGKFTERHGPIILREWGGVKFAPKYAYLPGRWVLERLIFYPVPDLPGSTKGHYEPAYVFQANDGTYLHPIRKAVEYAMWVFMNGRPVSKGELETEEAEKDLRETAEMEELLGVNDDYLATMLHNDEAVVVPCEVPKSNE